MAEQIISEISKNYAKALVESASDSAKSDLYLKQLNEILETIDSSEDLNVVLSNSSVSAFKKIEIIDEIFGGKIEQKLLNFLKILIEKNRFNELNSIVAAYKQIIEKQNNKKTVEIISPIELNFENKSNALFKLEHKLNCEVSPIWKTDKSLIAGLVFKFDDYVIDTSVRARLENLSKALNRG